MAAQFGMIGLGTMGRNLVLNMADHGITVCGYDRDPSQQQRLREEGKSSTVQVATNMKEFVESLETPRRVMMLVPAGRIVDAVIDEILPFLKAGDILVDGGNSHFTDTDKRIERLQPSGIHFTGMGVSGGEDGARLGPSMMPGGNKNGYAELKNILEKIAAKTEDGPCVTFIGNGSAGHYTKMVHNGIEYAMMQLISEAYSLLKNVCGCDNSELHEIFSGWNKGLLQSFLVEITAKILLQPDDTDKDRQLVDMILDRAAQKGTGMWTTESAMELHVPLPSIDEAVAARDLSFFKPEREKISQYFTTGSPVGDKDMLTQSIRDALYFGFAVSYIQGLHLLQTASTVYEYEINIAEVLRIWKGGCIIRSAIINDLRKIYLKDSSMINGLLDKDFYLRLLDHDEAVRNTLMIAMDNAIPTPCLSSCLHYVNMFGTARLPSNLIQAQRDYFGAHTYERTDKPGNFHTDWT